MTVLLADDDLSFGRGLALLLRPHFHTLIASGSADALARCDEACPDAALIDLDMPTYLAPHPEEEGMHLARALKQRFGTDFPIILVTRHELREIPQPFLAEVDSFFHKPLCAESLVSRLHSLIQESGDR